VASFLGNTDIVERLDTKLRSGRLPHALIFSGPEGIGKRTYALRVAKTLNCIGDTESFCDSCTQCEKVSAGTHPDIFFISVEADATRIKIEQVRKLLTMLALRPMEGSAKIFLIDPAESMTPGAANALLKALEEPPPRTFFILITRNVHDLLLTIRSRSQVYHFSPLTLEQVRRAGVDDELVVRWSQGSIGRAFATDPEALREGRDAMLEFLEHALTASEAGLASLLTASAELGRSKDDYGERVRILGVLISDLLFLKEGIQTRLVNVDIEDQLLGLASGVTVERLVEIGDCLKFIESNLKYNVNRQMMTDVLALTLNPSTAGILNDN